MHFPWIRAVKINHIYRKSFAKICLYIVHTHVNDPAQFFLIPFRCFRIGKINHSDSGHPLIGLPYISFFVFDKVAFVPALFKELGFLAHLGIDPDANFYSVIVDLLSHLLCIPVSI